MQNDILKAAEEHFPICWVCDEDINSGKRYGFIAGANHVLAKLEAAGILTALRDIADCERTNVLLAGEPISEIALADFLRDIAKQSLAKWSEGV